ncbi:hypothetical protein [Amycolatopsis sp. cmx-4-68]|uniref:hypothetical protein n=1 Tax=Amycolatopsis sp. cmx-4-68 TaxID=2790938 RepID=UPI003979E450
MVVELVKADAVPTAEDEGGTEGRRELTAADAGAEEELAAALKVLELTDLGGTRAGKYLVLLHSNTGVQVGDHNTHDELALTRIVPRAPVSMVNVLAERIARPTPDAGLLHLVRLAPSPWTPQARLWRPRQLAWPDLSPQIGQLTLVRDPLTRSRARRAPAEGVPAGLAV